MLCILPQILATVGSETLAESRLAMAQQVNNRPSSMGAASDRDFAGHPATAALKPSALQFCKAIVVAPLGACMHRIQQTPRRQSDVA